MKKVCIFIICCIGSVLFSHKAKAVEISLDGKFIISAIGYNALDFNKGSASDSANNSGFDVWQRVQLGLDFITSESLKGRFMLFTPYVAVWGQDDFTVGSANADSLDSFQVGEAYVDFIIPSTEISLKIGMQGFGINYLFDSGSPILDDFVPGVLLDIPINDELNLNLAWFRMNAGTDTGTSLINDDNYADFYMFSMPTNFDNMSFNPHFAFAQVGNDAELEAYAGPFNPFESNTQIYYAGINLDITLFDPFTLAADFLYSWADTKNAKAKAWLADLSLAYHTGNGALKFYGWYASGDEAKDVQNDKYGRIPTLSGGWGTVKSAFFDQAALGIGATAGVVSPTGSWALALEYDGYRLVDDISLGGHLMWINGTNDSEITYFDGSNERDPAYMSVNDSVVDLSAWAEYSMYKEMQVSLNISYLIAQFEESNYSGEEEDGFKAGLSFQYSF